MLTVVFWFFSNKIANMLDPQPFVKKPYLQIKRQTRGNTTSKPKSGKRKTLRAAMQRYLICIVHGFKCNNQKTPPVVGFIKILKKHANWVAILVSERIPTRGEFINTALIEFIHVYWHNIRIRIMSGSEFYNDNTLLTTHNRTFVS